MTAVAGVLVAVAVIAAAVSTLGVLRAHDAFDRLHYVGPAAVLGGTALALAALAARLPVGVVMRVALVVVVLHLATALTTHATGRAGLARGDLARIRDDRTGVTEP